MTILVLDAEPLAALAGPTTHAQRQVRRYLEVAARLGRDVIVPTVVLAELYRGPGRNAMVDACLAREERALACRDTDRHLARYVGGVLAGSRAGSEFLADAHVVATAVEAGGGVILTSDPDDLSRLAAPYPSVIVENLSTP